MKNRNLLLLDVPNIMHRSWHGMRSIKDNSRTVNVAIMGLLKSLVFLRDVFGSKTDFVFCFDVLDNRRKKQNPNYKANRTRNEEIDDQIQKLLISPHLEDAGFSNIFYFSEWEADDIIAAVAQRHRSVIVSTDRDLLQCLRPGVTIWHPVSKHEITHEEFEKSNFGLKPYLWQKVKALAGCTSDNIEGIPGVGERTAIGYLMKTLQVKHRAYKLISEASELVENNLQLTTLPHPEADFETEDRLEIISDKVDSDKWDGLCGEFEIPFLIGKWRW